jgi:serine/threonine-protein kinase RsbW
VSDISVTHAEVEAAKLLIEVLELLERDVDARLRVIADALPASTTARAGDTAQLGGPSGTARPKVPGDRPSTPGRRSERLELRVLPTPIQLPVVRAMAGDLAMRMDYDLDAVEDLRLAVDEACATLSAIVSDDRRLTVVFETTRRGLHIDAWVPTAEGTDVPRDGFGWAVLHTLVDEVQAGPATQATVPAGDGTASPVAVISMAKYLPGQHPDQRLGDAGQNVSVAR